MLTPACRITLLHTWHMGKAMICMNGTQRQGQDLHLPCQMPSAICLCRCGWQP